MRLEEFDNRAAHIRNTTGGIPKVVYRPIQDFAMCLGSAIEGFRIWIQNDLRYIMQDKIQYTYIQNQHDALHTFYFTEAMLTQVAPPNLSLQFEVDHTYENENYKTASLRSWEAINMMDPKLYMDTIIKVDEQNTNFRIMIAYRPIRINIGSGVVCQSRMHATNLTYAWNTKRIDNQIYQCKMLLEFQFPDEVIELIYSVYGIDNSNHRPMLRWLNRHCPNPVFYALNTYTGKPKFFMNVKVVSLIKPSGLTNPQPIEDGTAMSDIWTTVRNFEMDVVMPMFYAISDYNHPELPVPTNSKQYTELEQLKGEKLKEYCLQIEDKHAICTMEYKLHDEDIIKLPSGKLITNKIDVIKNMIEHDEIAKAYLVWGRSIHRNYEDLFEFVVMRNVSNNGMSPYTRIGKGHTLSEAIDKLGLKTEEAYKGFIAKNQLLLETNDDRLLTVEDIDIPQEELEYDHYIKNTNELWFIDLDPQKDARYTITIYCSIHLYNQFIMDTRMGMKDHITQYDMAKEYANAGNDVDLNDPQIRY